MFLKGPFLDIYLVLHVNDLTENLDSNPKLFADDTSLSSTVNNVAQSNSQLNSDLTEINDCAYKCNAQRMKFSIKYFFSKCD